MIIQRKNMIIIYNEKECNELMWKRRVREAAKGDHDNLYWRKSQI